MAPAFRESSEVAAAPARRISRLGAAIFRARFVLLTLWGIPWMLPASRYTLPANNDWIPFEVAARTLVHYHHIPAFETPALHVFADSPMLQFGPLPAYLVAAFQAFRPHAVAVGFAVAMIGMGVASMAALESAVLTATPAPQHGRVRIAALALAILLVPVWSFEIGFWHHLDDAIALLCFCVCLRIVAKQGRGWQFALLAGTAAATKPWAVILVPLLLALPRREWRIATLLTAATVLVWWAPFVVAAPDTVTALGGYSALPTPGSVLYLIGMHTEVVGWLRPLQLGAGMLTVGFLSMRGRWRSALLAGAAVRLLFEPFSFSYYVMGPLLGAFVLDLTRASRRLVPIWSPLTLLGVWALPRLNTVTPLWAGRVPAVHLHSASAVARLLWAAGVTGVLLATRRSRSDSVEAELPRG